MKKLYKTILTLVYILWITLAIAVGVLLIITEPPITESVKIIITSLLTIVTAIAIIFGYLRHKLEHMEDNLKTVSKQNEDAKQKTTQVSGHDKSEGGFFK